MDTEPQKRKRRFLKYAALFALLLFAVFVVEFRVIDRVHFALLECQNEEEWKTRSLWLPDYRLVREIAIPEIEQHLSGLTWNEDTGTLFAVTNNPPRIFELSPSGGVLRRIALRGFSDTEAVEYVGDGRYVIGEERKRSLVLARIDGNTSEIRAEGLPRMALDAGYVANWGLEGVAWNPADRKLYVTNERFPVHIHEITGFPPAPGAAAVPVSIGSDEPRDARLFVSDLAGLDFVHGNRHLLALSEASKLVIELDETGRPISSLSLLWGHGMTGWAPQPEGVALDDQGTLYLVSEPNLFYVFKKQESQP